MQFLNIKFPFFFFQSLTSTGTHLVYSNYLQSLFNIAILLKATDVVGGPLPNFERTILCGMALKNRSPFPKEFVDSLENISSNAVVSQFLPFCSLPFVWYFIFFSACAFCAPSISVAIKNLEAWYFYMKAKGFS